MVTIAASGLSGAFNRAIWEQQPFAFKSSRVGRAGRDYDLKHGSAGRGDSPRQQSLPVLCESVLSRPDIWLTLSRQRTSLQALFNTTFSTSAAVRSPYRRRPDRTWSSRHWRVGNHLAPHWSWMTFDLVTTMPC